MSDERYPIGKFTPVPSLSVAERLACIDQIAAAPANFRKAFAGLNEAQLDTPYRSGGWTGREGPRHLPASAPDAWWARKAVLSGTKAADKTHEGNAWWSTPGGT